LALKIETLEGKKKAKLNGTNFEINPVDSNYKEVKALKYGNNRGGYNQSVRGGLSQFRVGVHRGYKNSQPNRSRGGLESATRGGHSSYQN
jgi:hypothetical protein